MQFRSDYFRIRLEREGRVVVVTRTETPFPSLSEVRTAFAAMFVALDRLGRAGRGLLCDLRLAPGRNDPEFEKLMNELRPHWLQGFRRVGVLVRSTVGALQIRRYARGDGMERLVSSDEAVLMEYLLS